MGSQADTDSSGVPYLSEQTDLEQLHEKLLTKNRLSWKLESHTKSKLCTFIKTFDYEENKILVKANLDRRKRSLVMKYKSGVFPIRLKTGRYKGVKEEKRVCQVCNNGAIENEIHFTFKCSKLEATRKLYLPGFLTDIGVEVKKDEDGNDI